MRPNLFLVGAPKAATTSFHDYLGQHPDIFMTQHKEPFYFCHDLREESDAFHGRKRFFYYRSRDEYESLFDKWNDEEYAGESSVYYLYSETAAENIYQYNEDAHILISLREPVDFLESFHAQMVESGNETEDISTALELENARKDGEQIPSSVFFPSMLWYREMASFPDQVRRYLDAFPRNRIKFILFDDIVEDTEAVYKEVLDWLGLPQHSADFSVKNTRSRLRVQFLRRAVRLLDIRVKKFLKDLQFPYSIYTFLKRLNLKSGDHDAMPEKLRERLREDFAEDVAELARLTGKDLEEIWGY